MKAYLAWPWTPWIIIYLGHKNFAGYQLGRYDVNYELVYCSWFDYLHLLFGLLALIPLWFVWEKQRSDGVQTAVRLRFSAAVVAAAVHLFVNGLGLVGPAPCPADSRYRSSVALPPMPMSAANTVTWKSGPPL